VAKSPSPFLPIALAYAARGWRVHPLKPRDKTPISAKGCTDATLDPDQIRKWWTQWPTANIGLATGYEFFAIDVDPRHGGGEWLEANELPATHEAATGSGGKHLLYRMPSKPIHNSASLIAPGIDIRGNGGYIVAAPSIHPSGNPYTWLDCDGDVPEGPCADAPVWLVDMLVRMAAPAAGQQFALPDLIPQGNRDNTLYKFACQLRSKTPMTLAEIRAALEAANARCQPPMEAKDLDRIANSACRHPSGLSPEYAALVRPPRNAEPPPPDDFTLTALDAPDDDGSGSAKLTPNVIAEQILRETQIINVDGYLYEYDRTHWKLISTARLKALAMQHDGRRWTTQKRRGEVASFITDLTHRKDQEWRRLQPYEIPVANGVLDIRSMSLRPHAPEDYLQACVPIPYDHGAQCATLMKCLDTYFGKDDDSESKTNALQEFFGYCLMPHARYKKALMCVGESDCGKSTIPFLLRILVGAENMCAVSVEDMDDPRKRAPLMGKLVNALTELPSEAMIADGGFKTLVATEEPIQFDPKYLPPIMDIPIAKHVIVTNELPKITDRSKGTFNRLMLVQFNHVIPKNQQDRSVWDHLRLEASGILSWALEGAARLYHAGGTFTDVGAREMAEYIADQNPVDGFIREECLLPDATDDPQRFRAPLREMRARFEKWYSRPTTPQHLAKLLRSAGFEVGNNPVWFGEVKARPVLGLRLRGYEVSAAE